MKIIITFALELQYIKHESMYTGRSRKRVARNMYWDNVQTEIESEDLFEKE